MADDPSAPTQFGWDASHYDGILTVYNLLDALAEGIVFFTHKIGEGRSYDDPLDATNLAAARDAGIEFIGGYYVVRSTDITAQVDNLIALADRDEPWWRDWPGWFWQVDLERWPTDDVPASTGIAFGRLLRERTGRQVILYASRGQYGDQLVDWDGPLWNAAYGANPESPFKDIYPGDDSPRWAPYSGQVPAILQYGSRAIIAGLTTCDANAFRGTLEELRALITGDDMSWQERFPNPGIDDKAWPDAEAWEYLTYADKYARDAADRATAIGAKVDKLTADVAALAEVIKALAIPAPAPVDEAKVEAAAERAVRKVLGAVDGATPAP